MFKNLQPPLVPLLALIFCVLGCSVFSGKGDAEMVFAATEVGTLEGDKVSKEIGPAGGTLSSPDGRITLTVPRNALTETLPFSIQPISNKAGNGLGVAYRLEPDGSTFKTPLEISVRYDEKDLEGTVPEALSLAYQDKKGAWHAQTSAKLDQAAKTLTFSTTHFTDVAFLARLRMRPPSATIYVGESQSVELTICKELSFFDKIRGVDPRDSCSSRPWTSSWSLDGEGTLSDYESDGKLVGVMYNAPARKPKNNIANVDLAVEFEVRDPTTGRVSMGEGNFRTIITILDRGYRATGQTADLKYSGTICDLEKPFTVNGSVINYKFKFTPKDALSGKVEITAGGMSVTGEGGGSYVIEGADTDSPRIAVAATVTGHAPVGSKTGSGTIYIDLIPIEGECKQGG